MERMDFLKERAKEFWECALKDFEEKRFNLSAFHIEQAIQLYIKYLIGKEIGEWPQTHYLSELLEKLIVVFENEKIKKFKEENELFFEILSDAYFSSIYYPKTFSKTTIEKIMKNSKEFFNTISWELKDNFFK